MNQEAKKTLIFVGAALVIGIFGVAVQSRRPTTRAEVMKQVGQPLFEEFKNVDDVASLEITEVNEELASTKSFKVAKRIGTDVWVLPSESNYPADATEQVRDAASQAHPDYNGTIRRLAPLDAKIRAKLGEKPAAAPETPHGKEPSSEPSGPVVEGPLSEADEAPFAQAQASLARVEEALTKHEGTVFSSPDLEQPTGFEQLLANARAYLSRVRTRNPQVVALEAQLAAAEQRYAAREAESREQLERLHADGDYDARVQETIADLKKNGNARAPAFPRTWSPAPYPAVSGTCGARLQTYTLRARVRASASRTPGTATAARTLV